MPGFEQSELVSLYESWKLAQAENRLYGFGLSKALALVPLLTAEGLDLLPRRIFDSNPALHGSTTDDGFEVLSPEGLGTLNEPKIIVFTAKYEGVKNVLVALGLKEYRDFISATDIIWDYIYLAVYKKTYLQSLITAVTLKCTLRCRHCVMFVPRYHKPRGFSVEKLCSEADLLFNFVNYIHSFSLIGGEPFLHEGFAEYIDYLGRTYPERIGKVVVATNGTVGPSQEIMKALNRHPMFEVRISDYSVAGIKGYSSKLRRTVDTLRDNNVRHVSEVFQWRKIYCDDDPRLNDLTVDGLIKHYQACGPFCAGYQDGGLQLCSTQWSAVKCGLCPEQPDGYLGLDQLNPASMDDKLRVLHYGKGRTEKGFLEFCRYCYGFAPDFEIPTKTAEQETRRLDGIQLPPSEQSVEPVGRYYADQDISSAALPDEAVIDLVNERFSSLKSQKVVLYGTGLFAQALLRHRRRLDFSIVGVLDPELDSGQIEGVPILSAIADVPAVAGHVLIAATLKWAPAINRRILFLEERGVEIHWANGRKYQAHKGQRGLARLMAHSGPVAPVAAQAELMTFMGMADELQDSLDAGELAMIDSFIKRLKTLPVLPAEGGGSRIEVKRFEDFGYLFFGPAVYYFVHWLMDKAIANKEEILLFLARDGYIWHKVYDKVRMSVRPEAPPAKYFYFSRRAASTALIQSHDDLRWLVECEPFGKSTLREWIKNIFGINAPPDSFNQNTIDCLSRDDFFNYLNDNYWLPIIDEAGRCRCNFLKYFSSLNVGKRFGMVDFVTSFKTHASLRKLLTEHEIHSYVFSYLKRHGVPADMERLHQCFHAESTLPTHLEKFSLLADYVPCEMFYASPEGTALRFDANGFPVLEEETGRDLEALNALHHGAEQFADEMAGNKIMPSRDLAEAFFAGIFSNVFLFSDNIKKYFCNDLLWHGSVRMFQE